MDSSLKDMAWWVEFLGQWNGISFFFFPTPLPSPEFSVSSDTSGAIDYGAFMDNKINGSMVSGLLPNFHCP